MILIAIVLASGIAAGLLVAAVMTRWPTVDPAAPHMKMQNIAEEVVRHPRFAAFARSRLDPKVATGFLLTLSVLGLTVGVAIVGLLLVMVRTHTGFAAFDGSAARFGAQHATAASTNALRQLTHLGGAVLLLPLTVIVALVEVRRRRPFVVACFLVLAVIGQFLVANGVKSVVSRARPDVLRLTGFSGSSFPSGHAAAGAACFAAFALVLGRGRSRAVRIWLASGAVGLAVAIAATRVLLGVHWLTDVIAGLVIGWSWFAFCSIAFGGRILHFAEPVAVAENLTPSLSESTR